MEDFSWLKLADHYDISRQAVRDNLKRAEYIRAPPAPSLARREARLALLDQLASHTDEAWGKSSKAEIEQWIAILIL